MPKSVAWTTQHGACLSHFHSSIELLYMIRGSMTVILDGVETRVHEGECLFCSSYVIHSYQEEGEHESVVAIIPLTAVPMIGKSLASGVFESPILRDEDGSIRLLLEMMVQASENDNQTILKGVSYTLLGIAIERSRLRIAKGNAQSELIRDILKYIHEHIDQPLYIRDVAGAFGYSESRFSHLFQERLKRTMHDYVRQLRCQQAAQLLRESEIPVPEIAMAKGFESLQTFYRAFKHYYGMTPASYRRLHAEPGSIADSSGQALYRMEQHAQ